MIEGVQLKQLTTHADERGFFREVLRGSDEIFKEGFGQWSHSMMHQGTIKAFHLHHVQYDYWYVAIGVIKAVLVDLRSTEAWTVGELKFLNHPDLVYPKGLPLAQFLLGENQPAQVLKIPPGVAHGLKVLQGPAHLFYITSREYDPADEGRIPFDSLGYDWHKVEIK